MKKIITSASLAVLGAASIQATTPLDRSYYAPNPDMTPEQRSKWWSVSASLRGFYDDNYSTLPKGLKQSSYGYEIAPTLGINIPLEQTYIGLNYTYSMRYYEDRYPYKLDQSHQADLVVNHSFSETAKLSIKDSFVASQEPTVLEPGVVTAPLRRSQGTNLRNHGDISTDIELSRQFSITLGYENSYYDYEQDGAGSYSALLDRMEHLGKIDFRWHVQPQTFALVGYQYGKVNYKSEDSLRFFDPLKAIPGSDPSVRENHSHYLFVGADHSFTGQLRASARVGAQYTKYPNLVTGDDDSITPYADASLSYAYTEGSSATVGIRHAKNQTDIAYVNFTDPGVTVDAETTTFYGVISHKITSQITGSLIGQVQHSTFQGGAADDEVDNLYLVGVNVVYNLNRFVGLEAGYNFDRLDSDLSFGGVGRSFSRNRVYIGVRATY